MTSVLPCTNDSCWFFFNSKLIWRTFIVLISMEIEVKWEEKEEEEKCCRQRNFFSNYEEIIRRKNRFFFSIDFDIYICVVVHQKDVWLENWLQNIFSKWASEFLWLFHCSNYFMQSSCILNRHTLFFI